MFFATASDFRRWLERHHRSAPELLVGYYKVGSGRPSMTWSESVDQALCFGWIDGIRRRRDEESYTIRFTPRRPGSIWSTVNLRKMVELEKAGLVHPEGQAAFGRRIESRSEVYAYENRHQATLDPSFEAQFKRAKPAWAFWQAQPPGYRKLIVFWIMSAKQDATRNKRMARLIKESAAGRRLR